jgi:hypothetical protein
MHRLVIPTALLAALLLGLAQPSAAPTGDTAGFHPPGRPRVQPRPQGLLTRRAPRARTVGGRRV